MSKNLLKYYGTLDYDRKIYTYAYGYINLPTGYNLVARQGVNESTKHGDLYYSPKLQSWIHINEYQIGENIDIFYLLARPDPAHFNQITIE
jgi:hypothetical protein